MKKSIVIIGAVSIGLLAVFPLLVLVFACCGYDFSLRNYDVVALVTCVMSVAHVVLFATIGRRKSNGAFGIMCGVSLLLYPLNFIFWMFKSGESAVVFICAVVCFASLVAVTMMCKKFFVFRLVSVILAGVMLMHYVPIMILGSIGSEEIVEKIESPSKKYYAELVNADQGALGGDTIVNVYETVGFENFMFTVKAFPKEVYRGDWYEWENLDMYWKNDTCLCINSQEIEVR